MIDREREGTVVLPDGRALAYTLRDDPAGMPFLGFYGLPSPRRAATVSEDFLRERGILLVAVDRPGVGHSTAQPGRNLLESYALAFRQGTAGQIRDWPILAMPWLFRPKDVPVPVRLFLGALDDRVPLHHAEHLAVELPDARLTVYPHEGHMIIQLDVRGLAVLVAAHNMAAACRGGLRLTGVTPAVLRLLAVTRLDEVFSPVSHAPHRTSALTRDLRPWCTTFPGRGMEGVTL